MRGWLKSVCLGVGCVGVLGACAEDVDSDNVKTDGMYADFSVTARQDGQSEVRASIRIGGGLSNTYADLSAGDVLSATSDTESHVLTEVGGTLGNVHIYHADFDGAEEGKEFTVSFDREDDDSAPNSTTELPAPFAITAPAQAAEVSRADALTVTWSPASSGDRMRIHTDGDCTRITSDGVTADPGTFTFAVGDIDPIAGREGDTCNVEVRITRERSGSVDPAFGEGGRFDAIQERTISFRSTP